MDDIATFGQVYTRTPRGYYHLGVRYYKGKPVPWVPHDCTESNSCSFCRSQKRKMAARLKNSDS